VASKTSPTFGAATTKETGQTGGARTSTGTGTLPRLLTAMPLESGRHIMWGVQTHKRSEVAVAGHIPGQVGLDSRGLLGSFAGVAEGNTHPAPEAVLKR